MAQEALCTILNKQLANEKQPYDVDMIKLLKYIIKYKKIDFKDKVVDKDSMVIES